MRARCRRRRPRSDGSRVTRPRVQWGRPMNESGTTPNGAGPQTRATRYYVERDANGPLRLFRGEPGGERWMPDGTWHYSAYTWITYQGLGGDAYDAPEIGAADVPAVKAALAERWRRAVDDRSRSS